LKRVVCLLLALLFWPGQANATDVRTDAPGAVAFDVYMNGARVGRHSVAVSQTGSDLRADVRIDMAGRVGPFAFTYAHRCQETWRAGALAALSCEDREGRKTRTLSARADGARLAIDANGRALTAPVNVLPSTWWRVSTTSASNLLDTRNGKPLAIRVRTVGREEVATPAGPIAATRYRLEGSTTVDVWYDAMGRWVKMAFRLRGQSFEYKLATPPVEAPRG